MCGTALLTALSGLVVFCFVTVDTLTWILLPSFILVTRLFFDGFDRDISHLERSGCNLDCNKKNSPYHACSKGYHPENIKHCNNFDSIQQNLSRNSHACNPTTQNLSAESPRKVRNAPNCRGCLVDPPGVFLFYRCLISCMSRNRHCVNATILIYNNFENDMILKYFDLNVENSQLIHHQRYQKEIFSQSRQHDLLVMKKK